MAPPDTFNYKEFLKYVVNALVDDKKWEKVKSFLVDDIQIYSRNTAGLHDWNLGVFLEKALCIYGKKVVLRVDGETIIFYQNEYTRYNVDVKLGRI
mgnify:CR=1 FL=1